MAVENMADTIVWFLSVLPTRCALQPTSPTTMAATAVGLVVLSPPERLSLLPSSDPGSRVVATEHVHVAMYVSWILHPGYWILDPGARIWDFGSWVLALGS